MKKTVGGIVIIIEILAFGYFWIIKLMEYFKETSNTLVILAITLVAIFSFLTLIYFTKMHFYPEDTIKQAREEI